MNRIILAISLLIFAISTNSQELNFKHVDSTTYALYLKKDWKPLIEISKQAIENNIDYYYLRMRLAIAYYEQKKYMLAVPQFKKAKEFDKNDLIDEYLYYSYLYGGNNKQAQIFSKKVSPSLKKTIIKPKYNKSILIDYQHNNNQDYNFDYPDGSLFDQVTVDRFRYLSIGHKSNYKKNSTSLLSYSNYKIVNNIIHNDPLVGENIRIQEISENQLYYSNTYHFRERTNIGFAFNLTLGSNKEEAPPNTFSANGRQANYINSKFLNFVPNINFSHGFNRFNIISSVSFGAIEGSSHFQPEIGLVYYPLANKNLYIKTAYSYYFSDKNESELLSVFSAEAGFTINKKYSLDLKYAFGDFKNYVESNAYIIYNFSNNYLNDKAEITLSTNFQSRVNFYFRYQYLNMTNVYELYRQNQEINYTNQTFLGGIKWNFTKELY